MATCFSTLTLGSYTFDPVPPEFTINKEFIRTPSGHLLNVVYTGELVGTLFLGGIKGCAGLSNLNNLRQTMEAALVDCSGCKHLLLKCNTDIILSAIVKVTSLSFLPTQNNWVDTIDYNLSVTWNASEDITLTGSGTTSNTSCFRCLTSVDEQWEVTSDDAVPAFTIGDGLSCSGRAERFNVSHTISAQGVNCCTSGITLSVSGNVTQVGETAGWKIAKDWVLDRLASSNTSVVGCSGVLAFNPANYSIYNHTRTKSTNIYTGDFSVTENWTAISNTDFIPCVEDYTVDANTTVNARYTSYSINGSIQGLETKNADFSVNQTKLESAESCFSTIQGRLLNRVNCLAASGNCAVNSQPLTTTISRNPNAGSINYNYTYDNRPSQLIPGSIWEDINISDQKASKAIGRVPILGGPPVLIDCSSTTETTRTVSIQAIFPYVHCSGSNGALPLCTRVNSMLNTVNIDENNVEILLCCIETNLENDPNLTNVHKINDTPNFGLMDGNYSRQVQWIYTQCNNSGVETFC